MWRFFAIATICLCPTFVAAAEISACGRLIEGVECTLFQADDGQTYALGNLGGFNVGAEVWVRGEVIPDCITFCSPTAGCVFDNTIAECYDICGTLVAGPQGCPAIELNVAVLIIENAGVYPPGTAIHVRGCFNPESRLCSPLTLPGIEDNTIETCCAEDIDNDGVIGLSDLAALLAVFGTHPGDANFDPAIDFDSDNEIGIGDLAFLLAAYGLPCGF
ncbi:MAG: hypothetical protein KDA32_05915 [Phycisphaerales bacterium]|nr:hypothetical protein [Phycisphaerales bacterium]